MARPEIVFLVSTRALAVRAAATAALGIACGAAAEWAACSGTLSLPMAIAECAVGGILAFLLLESAWRTVRALLRRRTAWHTLSLLACPLPAGWRGPYLVDPRDGTVGYAIEFEEDGTRVPAEVIFVSTGEVCGSEEGLMAYVRGPDEARPVPDARSRALLRQLLETDWESAGQPPFGGTVLGCLPGRPRQPFALNNATCPSPVPEWPRFTRAIELPAPVAFPREPFAAELARHEELVRAHLDGLAFQARLPANEFLAPLDFAGSYVGEIVVRGGELKCVRVLRRRAHAAHLYENILGVRHALQLRLDLEQMQIIVRSDDLVSMHLARAHEVRGKTAVTRSLVLESPSVVFEPARQEHARRAGRTTVYWQAAPGAVVHVAFTTAPEPARSNAEATDRLLALRLERIRRAVWGGGARHRLSEGFLWYCDNRLGGEAAIAADFVRADMLGFLEGYPAIQRAICAHRAYGEWYPVVIDSVRHAGLRWLPMRVGLDESSRPDAVDEVSRTALLHVVEG